MNNINKGEILTYQTHAYINKSFVAWLHCKLAFKNAYGLTLYFDLPDGSIKLFFAFNDPWRPHYPENNFSAIFGIRLNWKLPM